MKVTLSEIKENVQEVNSGVDEDIYLFDPCCTQGLELGWHKVRDQEIFVQGSNWINNHNYNNGKWTVVCSFERVATIYFIPQETDEVDLIILMLQMRKLKLSVVVW